MTDWGNDHIQIQSLVDWHEHMCEQAGTHTSKHMCCLSLMIEELTRKKAEMDRDNEIVQKAVASLPEPEITMEQAVKAVAEVRKEMAKPEWVDPLENERRKREAIKGNHVQTVESGKVEVQPVHAPS